MAILTPRREAHRKVRKGKNNGTASRCNYVAFGDWGLMSLDNERVTSRQIEVDSHFPAHSRHQETLGRQNG